MAWAPVLMVRVKASVSTPMTMPPAVSTTMFGTVCSAPLMANAPRPKTAFLIVGLYVVGIVPPTNCSCEPVALIGDGLAMAIFT